MLGSGQTLPGSCRLSDGQIEPTSVLATYALGGGGYRPALAIVLWALRRLAARRTRPG
jgi:hypothetical protein